VRDHGALLGVVMTADRLMRCSYWTEAGRDYTRLPDGTLHDPVAGNLLTQP
jgi:putative component of membrane protein insertase Oxa1/YidC/SpoIIIJ protein YidD